MSIKIVKRLALFVILFFSVAKTADARVLPRFQKSTPAKSAAVPASSLTISVKLRPDRKALNVVFGNINKVNSVTYTLMYQSNGVNQGVSGTLNSGTGVSTARELLFGTCSSGVCRYHTGITNMTMEVTTELLTGKKTLRRYRIRV